jgi:hypothetical protein
MQREIDSVMGYFASPLYLRMCIGPEERFVDLVRQVTAEYCDAFEHADSSWIASQEPRPPFTGTTAFNWSPLGSRIEAGLDPAAAALRLSPMPFVYPLQWNLGVDGEPSVQFRETEHRIIGDLYFPRGRFSTAVMERFARIFVGFIRVLIEAPETRVRDARLCE